MPNVGATIIIQMVSKEGGSPVPTCRAILETIQGVHGSMELAEVTCIVKGFDGTEFSVALIHDELILTPLTR